MQSKKRTHPRLDGAEGMLNRLAAQRDFGWIIVEPLLDALKNVLVLPASDAALLAWGAPVLDRAAHAVIRPIVSQRPTGFLVRVVIREPLAGRAEVGIHFGVIYEVSPIKAPVCRSTGRSRFGDGDGDTGLLGGDDLLALVVPLVGDCLDSAYAVGQHRVKGCGSQLLVTVGYPIQEPPTCKALIGRSSAVEIGPVSPDTHAVHLAPYRGKFCQSGPADTVRQKLGVDRPWAAYKSAVDRDPKGEVIKESGYAGSRERLGVKMIPTP